MATPFPLSTPGPPSWRTQGSGSAAGASGAGAAASVCVCASLHETTSRITGRKRSCAMTGLVLAPATPVPSLRLRLPELELVTLGIEDPRERSVVLGVGTLVQRDARSGELRDERREIVDAVVDH